MSNMDVQNLQKLIAQILNPFQSAAILNSEGQILGLKYFKVTEIGTFAPLVQTVTKYCSPNSGDYIIANDPYIGGVSLAVFSLVTSFQVQDQKFYLAARVHTNPHLNTAAKLDQEGVRIPPTPIASKNKINEVMLGAISQHPMAPKELSTTINELLNQMHEQIQKVESWTKKHPNVFSKVHQKNLITETKSRILNKIKETPRGEVFLETCLAPNELLKVHIEIDSAEIRIDFAGTTPSKRIFLNDVATYGACLSALLTFLDDSLLINDGVLAALKVTTPQGSFLNAKFPSPVLAGIIEAAPIVANTVFQGLAQISSQKQLGLNSSFPAMYSLTFPDGSRYFDSLHGGSGASKKSNGIDGCQMWSLNRATPEIENAELKFPFLFRQSGIRQTSGGKGKNNGGNGILREIEMNSDAELNWYVNLQNTQIKNHSLSIPGSAGENAQIQVLKKSGEKVEIDISRGQMKLNLGDKVIVTSCGGGGFEKT